MLSADYYNLLIGQGYGPFTGVPCALVKGLISHVEEAGDSRYFIASSEGEAMGIAGGLALAGRTPVVMMQNDGYGNAINPLSSLQLVYHLPALLLITWRAEPGAGPDAIQHHLMGETLMRLLDTFNIPHLLIEDDLRISEEQLRQAKSYMDSEGKPFALIVRRGIFSDGPSSSSNADPAKPIRPDYINVLAEEAGEHSILLGTTGYTGRELQQAIDRPGTFYTAGSMGCIGSLGLGIATENSDRIIYVLDGDGALLMKMGTLATIGHYKPANLVHILFDNGQYESTGGQATVSRSTNFTMVAEGCGYAGTEIVDDLAAFRKFIQAHRNFDGPVLCHVKVQPGTLPDLKRPSDGPVELRDQFRNFLGIYG